jgi:hypothetical protein
MGLSTQHMQLSSYLPAEVVEAYQAMGMVHNLYQWQVGQGGWRYVQPF